MEARDPDGLDMRDETADVLYERRGAVALLTYNRPQTLNAWTDELGERYMTLLASADSDRAVRAIVVTGAGRGFCSGLDVGQLASPPKRTPAERERTRRARVFALEVRKPIIAAVNGPAAGLGLIQALLCDVRFAAADAKLTTAFARLGLPAEEGVSWLLSRLVGHGRAFDLLLSGRTILGAEAERIGLVERAIDADEVVPAAIDYARELAERCSPAAMATIKQQIREDATATFAEARDAAFRLMLEAFAHPDQREGAVALSERRPPRFLPLDDTPG